MPWHEPRLTGASGEPTVREGQGKLTRAENFYQRGRATVANELTSMKQYCLQARQAASWRPHKDGALVIPMCDSGSDIRSLQFIDAASHRHPTL